GQGARSSALRCRRRSRTVGPRQALLIIERRGPTQRLLQPAVVEPERLEHRLEPARDQDSWNFGGAPENGYGGQPHDCEGEPVRNRQAPARLAVASHVIGKIL